jgi:methionyl aminopeptidase
MISSVEDIAGMRAAGKLAALLLTYLGQHVAPGVTTRHLDELAAAWTVAAGARSGPLGYKGSGTTPFPASICTSVNEVICHGIPCDTTLANGDIVNIDVTPVLNGYYGDTSKTFAVGSISEKAQRLIDATDRCLAIGIEQSKPGNHIGDIGYAINTYATKLGYSIVSEFCGHGIGKKFHTPPYIPHFGVAKTGIKLVPGMIFTIEPILCMGRPDVKILNEWEVASAFGNLTAQAEHTILITRDGAEILTNESPRENSF